MMRKSLILSDMRKTFRMGDGGSIISKLGWGVVFTHPPEAKS